MEPSAWTAVRVRHSEQTLIDHGLSVYSVAARYDAIGDLAALSQIITEAEAPDSALQQVTAVLPGHRGHRLGLLVKIDMLDLTGREPAVRHFLTGNAGANAHMIAINEQLGQGSAGTRSSTSRASARLSRRSPGGATAADHAASLWQP